MGGLTEMTRARYHAFRHLQSALDLAEFTESERELLTDAAEGFLLADSLESDELADLTLTVVVTLEGAIDAGRMSRWAAEHARAWVDACGPMPDPRIPALA